MRRCGNFNHITPCYLNLNRNDMNSLNRCIALLLVLFSLAGCQRNPLKVDVSKIDIKLKIGRLDQDLFTVNHANFGQRIPELQNKYDPFFTIYNKEVLAIGNSSDSLYAGYLFTFLKDPAVLQAKSRSDSLFSNFQPYAQQLEQAFKHCHYYFPGLPTPVVVTYLSGFNQSIVTTPNAIGISLDNYLGSNCSFYRQLGFPIYKRANMEPRKMVYDAMYGWISQQFEYKGNTENLVSSMIYQGKLMYAMDALVPDGPDSLKIGFRKEQLDWCVSHEGEMWSYLIEKKMLFSGDRMELVRFINPAPFTTPFGQKSPGRTGVWLGWQIVKCYLKKNPGITLPALLEENDYHKILNESGYSPD